MSKPKTIHTIESIYARTDEVGECRIWKGYSINGTPMVHHNGKMVSVRRVVMSFFQSGTSAKFLACKCGTPGCVAYHHIERRSAAQHMAAMNAASIPAARSPARRARLSASKLAAGKLTPEAVIDIRTSPKKGPELAEQYGVSYRRIRQIRAGESSLVQNVWAGLMS